MGTPKCGWMLGCWWLRRPGLCVVSGDFGHQTDPSLNPLATTKLFDVWPQPVPRCLGLRSDQLVMKDERLIGVEFPGGLVNSAVGQGSQN